MASAPARTAGGEEGRGRSEKHGTTRSAAIRPTLAQAVRFIMARVLMATRAVGNGRPA